MALAFVMLGITVGTVAAALVFATDAGILAAFLAYAGGGMVGLASGVLFALLPRQNLLTAVPQTE